MLATIDIESTSPVALRSLVSSAMPRRMAWRGERIANGRPSSHARPWANRP